MEKEGIEPECVVYLTDGYCDTFPEKEPDFPVLWILTEDHDFNPPFGEVICIGNNNG